MLLARAQAADSTIYIPVPDSTITLINSKTFQPDGVILAGDTGSLALSATEKRSSRPREDQSLRVATCW